MSFVTFPCTCQFCEKRFHSPNLSNCCIRCWRLYKKFKKDKKKVEAYLRKQKDKQK